MCTPCRCEGGERSNATHTYPRHEIDTISFMLRPLNSGQLPMARTEQEAGWAQQPPRTFWKRKNPLPLQRFELRIVQPKVHTYTDYGRILESCFNVWTTRAVILL